LFRIDRNYVHLAATRYVQISNTDEETDTIAEQCPEAAVQESRADDIVHEIISDAKAKAGRIIEDARREVAELLLSARDQAEENRRKAWQEGFAEGSEEGQRVYEEQLGLKIREYDEQLDAKMRECNGKLDAKLLGDDNMLKHVIEELYYERKRAFNGLEDEVVKLAFGIVRKIISPVEDGSGEMFIALIKNALKQMNPDGKIVIRVSQAEYERFFPTGGAVFEMDSGVRLTATILKDPLLEDGGLLIDANDTTINAGLETQLKYVQLAFDELKIEN